MTTFRRLYAVLFFAFLFASIRPASAQTSVYGAVTLDSFGFTGGNYGNGSFKGDTAGFTGGAFYTFPSSSRFKAAIDGRLLVCGGYKGGQAYTGAFRAAFVPNKNRLRPSFQIGAESRRPSFMKRIATASPVAS